MKSTKAALCLALVLALPLAARADDNADKLAVATKLTEKTVLKNLDTGFGGALEKTVSTMPEDKAEKAAPKSRMAHCAGCPIIQLRSFCFHVS